MFGLMLSIAWASMKYVSVIQPSGAEYVPNYCSEDPSEEQLFTQLLSLH